MTEIVTGNGFELAVELQKNHKTFAIPAQTVLQAAVVSRDNKTLLAGPVNINLSAPGTDTAASMIIVQIPAALTSQITRYGPAKLEIKMTANPGTPEEFSHPSWFIDVLIVKSQIPAVPSGL